MKIMEKLKKLRGRTVKQFSLLGINIFSYTLVKEKKYNLFVLFLPLLRIDTSKGCSIHILLFTWICEAIKSAKDKFKKQREEKKYISYLSDPENYSKPKHYEALKKKLASGQKIRVVLFESRISCWQYDKLYQLLDNSPYFEPVVVLKPFVFQGKPTMISLMNEAYDVLIERGYRVVKGYSAETGSFIDVRKELEPDAVFYSMFWKPHFGEGFYIDYFEDIYSFLFSYGFDVSSHPNHESMNFELQNKVSRYYLYTPIHVDIAKANMDNLARNTYVTGPLKLDKLIDPCYAPVDVWKPQEKRKKRIIWAPHHSDGFDSIYYQFNAFYEIYDLMLELAEKYSDDIQFAFKPHPMLKPKLDKKWGVARANAYYQKWADMENSQLETGEFIDLFATSDAMILDSISFIAEYTITNKPAFFTIGQTTRVKLNDFGNINFEVLYKTVFDLKKDIESFVVDVVINGNDTKKAEREEFINKYLLPPNGKFAAENIYEDMVEIMVNGNYRSYNEDNR